MPNDSTFPKNYYNNSQLNYQFTNGVPISFTMYADQASQQQQHQGMTALYAQDRWTLNRLTLQGGLRFERLVDHFDQQQMGPNIFLPTAVVFPAQDGPLNHKDLQPRFGATYDVFGNGKTALKFFLGEYVTTMNTVDEWVNFSPAGLGHFVSNVQRTWVDANHDFVPNCNLLDQSAQNDPTSPGYNAAKDSCGVGNPFFGKIISPLTVDPAATTGWNTREHSWDLSAGISQQLAPRVSVDVTYNRRSWGNIATTINRALKPTDFNPFTYNVPKDPKLPGGGGYTLTFEEIAPAKYNQFDNLYTLADNAGGAYQPLQRRRRIGQCAPATGDHRAGGVQHRKRHRGRVRPGRAAPGRLHFVHSQRWFAGLRFDRSSAASRKSRSRSAIASRDGRRTTKGSRRTPCRRSTCCSAGRSTASHIPGATSRASPARA